MYEPLHTISTRDLHAIKDDVKYNATTILEKDSVIYFPNYSFTLQENESALLSEAVLCPKHKNISYNYLQKRVAGFNTTSSEVTPIMIKQFMHRFAEFAKHLLDQIVPHYSPALHWGRTSYRPAEIKGRKTSKRKDDTRLHVDSFSATPVQGNRILRIFCNINPQGAPRVWHVGEPFKDVFEQFVKKIKPYSPARAKLLKLIRATKTLRTPYDHYMLNLHDGMKLDDHYQKSVPKHRIEFLPKSTWIVFTDKVSHAALSGQFLLEQTFYLPVSAMKNPELAPLSYWNARWDDTKQNH